MKQNRLIIPPRPGILLEIQALMQHQEVELSEIIQLIKKDASLYAILLSCVNSPWLGIRQEVTSAETAISLMGLERVLSLLQAVIIRSCFDDIPSLESFWDASVEVAGISQNLAEKYTTLRVEHAFSAGILHNVGVPIMLSNFDHYQSFLDKHAHRPTNEICAIERKLFGTDHYLQGALMTKSWFMNSTVSLTIRYQPITQSILGGTKVLPYELCSLLAVLTLAKDISGEYRHYWKVESCEFNTQCVASALNYLDISESEYAGIKEDTITELTESQVA